MWLYNFSLGLDLEVILPVSIFFFLIAIFLRSRNPPNYPPGPPGLPFVGNFFNLDHKHPHISFTKLAEAYGNVFSIRFGSDEMVFVCGYKMVKEAIVTQAENFVDRPYSPLFERLWSGKKDGERERYTEELTLIPSSLHISKLFNNAVSNIICQLVMGTRFDYSDHNFQIMLKYLSGAMQLQGSIWGLLYEAFPGVMKHLPGPHNKMFSYFKYLERFISQEVQGHKKDLDPNNPRDYIDTFILEMQNQHQGESNLGFNEANLALCSLDLFLAGTETTSTTLLWALTFLIKNPDVQEKVQAEIDRVIGQTRQPTMADRPNMPYTDAVIHEIQRMGNIVPLNGLRMAAKDTTLGGYFIPKGTALMPMLTSVLFDKNEWETPDTFNPGHFLDAEGKFVRREAFLPFSAGKRVCLGEGLARMELFLFFVSLFQKFTFSTLDGVELDTEGVIGATHVPHPFKVYAKAR
uniref:Cytochrome P450, family 2, subfamily N, polypeptide 13 n=1 Tax=Myripristis murdjan TaxID=586833 RepID=A0A667WH43_9TELE